MQTVLTSSLTKIEQIPNILEEKLNALELNLIQSEFSSPIYRLEIPIFPVDILNWLSLQSITILSYWSNREKDFEMGAVGCVDSFISDQLDYSALLKHCKKNLLPQFPQLRYYGGCAFDSRNIDDEWREFKAVQFGIPSFEIVNSQNQYFFCCNILIRKNIKNALKKTLKDSQELKFGGKINSIKEGYLSRRDFHDQETWNESFSTIVKKFRKELVQKVVLARKTVLKFTQDIQPFLLLKKFSAITPHCFHFAFQQERGICFTGASPERLYIRINRNLKTEAIAGTRKRGENPTVDQLTEKELLSSQKDLNEHMFVVQFIQNSLSDLCTSKVTKDLSVLKLQEGMHLLSEFEGQLKADISDEEILQNLHPTPAVAGTPTEEAVKVIKNWEPFSRGWYTGIIGYIGADSTEFAVGIRCGLIRKNIISLFAGAGIVQDSNPDQEWNEIESKISGFLKVLQE